MDTDLSHEALDRFDALEQRVTALEQAQPADGGQTDIFTTPDTPDEDEE